MNEKILFVDDEPNVLSSIRRQLHKRFDITISDGGDDALRILKKDGPFSVIVSDMRMPGMSGIELLARVKELYPETIRLMLTGNADQHTAIEAVNNGQIFRFLTKPCPQGTFVTALALALRQHRLVTVEKELLQQTLRGAVNVLTELLAVANPLAFSAGARIKSSVVAVAEALDLPRIWQFEIAALLSQIGCFSLPLEILHKKYTNKELTEVESLMFTNHPAVGAALLEKIPRLENITQMISLQMKKFDEYDDELTAQCIDEVLIGAQILHAVIEFDRQQFMGKGHQEALAFLCKQKNCYNPKVIEALAGVRSDGAGQIFSLKVEQITDGMTTTEHVTTKTGVLIIPKGQLITKPILQGLKNFATQVGVVEPIRVQYGQSGDFSEP